MKSKKAVLTILTAVLVSLSVCPVIHAAPEQSVQTQIKPSETKSTDRDEDPSMEKENITGNEAENPTRNQVKNTEVTSGGTQDTTGDTTGDTIGDAGDTSGEIGAATDSNGIPTVSTKNSTATTNLLEQIEENVTAPSTPVVTDSKSTRWVPDESMETSRKFIMGTNEVKKFEFVWSRDIPSPEIYFLSPSGDVFKVGEDKLPLTDAVTSGEDVTFISRQNYYVSSHPDMSITYVYIKTGALTQPGEWTMTSHIDPGTREYLVVEAKAIDGWESLIEDYKTAPVQVILWHLDFKTSVYEVADIKEIVLREESPESNNLSAHAEMPEIRKDFTSLVIGLFVAGIATIIVLIIFSLKKIDSAYREKKNYEIDIENKSLKIKKEKENEKLGDYLNPYNNDYSDDIIDELSNTVGYHMENEDDGNPHTKEKSDNSITNGNDNNIKTSVLNDVAGEKRITNRRPFYEDHPYESADIAKNQALAEQPLSRKEKRQLKKKEKAQEKQEKKQEKIKRKKDKKSGENYPEDTSGVQETVVTEEFQNPVEEDFEDEELPLMEDNVFDDIPNEASDNVPEENTPDDVPDELIEKIINRLTKEDTTASGKDKEGLISIIRSSIKETREIAEDVFFSTKDTELPTESLEYIRTEKIAALNKKEEAGNDTGNDSGVVNTEAPPIIKKEEKQPDKPLPKWMKIKQENTDIYF